FSLEIKKVMGHALTLPAVNEHLRVDRTAYVLGIAIVVDDNSQFLSEPKRIFDHLFQAEITRLIEGLRHARWRHFEFFGKFSLLGFPKALFNLIHEVRGDLVREIVNALVRPMLQFHFFFSTSPSGKAIAIAALTCGSTRMAFALSSSCVSVFHCAFGFSA